MDKSIFYHFMCLNSRHFIDLLTLILVSLFSLECNQLESININWWPTKCTICIRFFSPTSGFILHLVYQFVFIFFFYQISLTPKHLHNRTFLIVFLFILLANYFMKLIVQFKKKKSALSVLRLWFLYLNFSYLFLIHV